MKKLTILFILLAPYFQLFAQTNADSLAYELQRKKINNLLSIRKEKFGRYDVSLKQHTGIFGLQTKKDIRRSNKILMNIVETDDHIFKEIKILLDYRTFQQTQAQTESEEKDKDRLAYLNTINRLKNQQANLIAKYSKQADMDKKTIRNYVMCICLLLGFCVIFLVMLSKKKK